MKAFVSLILWCNLFLWGYSSAQEIPLDSIPYEGYTSMEDAAKTPLEVKILSLHKAKLKEFPLEICQFENLEVLDLSRNKIRELPPEIASLKNLWKLDVSSNKLENLPSEIGQLTNLRELIISRNDILELPVEMGLLMQLEYLDLYSNYIIELPSSMYNLRNTLKVLDMRGISMNKFEHDQVKKLLPKTKIFLSKACNCH